MAGVHKSGIISEDRGETYHVTDSVSIFWSPTFSFASMTT